MRRLGPLILIRALAAFLAVQVADTPIFCADQRPRPESPMAVGHSAAAVGDLHSSPDSSGGEAACCFCPCHLAFDAERSTSLVAMTRPTVSCRASLPADPTPPPQSLDHPPQKLG